MRDLREKRVLVTGGAQGIGFRIAERFAREGAEIVLTDVRPEPLAEAARALSASTRVTTAVLDVTDRTQVCAARDRVRQEAGEIDVLVNNAGVVFGGAFLDVPLERHELTYRVNVWGLVAVTHAFLPDLIARPEAHIVNIASASGFIGLPYGSTYASSKWAVIGFSESIRLELDLLGHHHVGVTTVCPSYVATGMFDGVRPPLFTPMLKPERLADRVIVAVKKGRAFVREPWIVKLTPALKWLLPTRVFDRIAWRLGATSSMQHWRGHAAGEDKSRRSA